jgi:SAM-dependent methyltransferase
MPAEELVRFCGRRRGGLGRVLEVGCGNGANLWYLAEQSEGAVGMDFCADALSVARILCAERGIPAAASALVLGSASHLPFADGRFDTVVELMVSQHAPWEAHADLYREYRRTLRPGGLAFLYHLMQGTSGTRTDRWDYPEGIPLFPEAGRVCVPPIDALETVFGEAGFGHRERRMMERVYPDGSVTRYAILEGTAQ